MADEMTLQDVECCDAATERKSHHSDKIKSNLVSRLRPIEVQIRGVKNLIDKN